MPSQEITDFIAGLPKVELHVHLVGSASPETVLELARRHPDQGVPSDLEALRQFFEFRDFGHFITVYIAVNSLVRTAADVEELTVGVSADLAAQNVRYAELTVTPDSHLLMGIAPDEVSDALSVARHRAAAEHGVELAYVFDIPGELGLPSGERTIDWVEAHAPAGSVGFGLGGPEAGVERAQFSDVFARAKALGLASVPHAGETTGPATIWDSLTHLHADRIGHGISSAKDPGLMAHLAEQGIPLEVCPTSNLRTGAVKRIEDHPFPVLRDAGVVVTLNSDDPGMFSTSLDTEYALAHDVFGLSPRELAGLARTALDVSYAPPDVRHRVAAEIEAYTHALLDPAP